MGKWLQSEHGCFFGKSRTMEWFEMYHHINEVVWAAVRENNLECLEWVLEQGVSWDEIIYGGYTQRVEWGDGTLDLNKLRNEFTFEINIDLCRVAAKMGHLKILQYAVEDGCPWIPEKCLEAAKKNKHDHVVKWITDGPH